ncbi:MAG: hypothetical protein GFH27_549293n164 [Chloroflexi bacterium AL-W]|nr:hypothetical protein [Chloroflexi bacterium AL-N1]NOK67721.1 hypothetical protein [Chloroflexi bacterium AL-N10]NOK75509.1 hypothetical protein [Chloroflexi bacterium AL-N5]NOK82297.1 hypothetical protein [Chloroflexi bacterium AL-W]NOK90142.1 hypothetical protein [Chloroflexi bacterium AL-N15]
MQKHLSPITKDTKALVLRAALNLIAEQGFHGTSMSKVAKEANISAATIYHYFAGKDELIVELYKSIKIGLMRAILADLNETIPLREQMRCMIRNVIRYLIARPHEAAFIEQFDRSPYNTTMIHEELGSYLQRLTTLIERASHEQIIKNLPDALMETFTLDVASSIARKHTTGALELTDETVEQVVDVCWDAIRR